MWPLQRLLFIHSVAFNSLWPHGLQHARLPCPSLTPGACSGSCPSSQRCHPALRRVYAPRFCLITTKIWSDGHYSPQRITAPGSWTDRVIALRQISVTALFYLENSRKIHLQGTRARQTKRKGKSAPAHGGERDPWPFGPSFYMFFSPPGPVLCKLGQPGVLFVLPEVLTLVLRPSFVLFSRAFPFLIFQPPPFWTPVSYSNYLTFTYIGKCLENL